MIKNLKKIDDTFNSEQNGSLTNDQIINKTKIKLNNIELGQGVAYKKDNVIRYKGKLYDNKLKEIS